MKRSHRTFEEILLVPPSIRLAAAAAVTLVAVVLILATSLSAASAGARAQNLQGDVDALVAAGAPGAILLVRDGTNTSRFTSGVADLATSRPIRSADHYRIASLTKSYVSTVALQLVGEGKLRLSDTVEKWLPGVVPTGKRITVRMLLNHTSGLHDYEKDPAVLAPYLSGNLGYYWSPRKLVKIAVSRPAVFEPGTSDHSSYSSTNYAVTALIIEAATGRSLGAELRRRIFEPLGLDATTYPTRQTQLPSPYAHGYFPLGPPPLADLSALSPSLSGPAGAIVSTVGDVADFYRALFAGKLLQPKLLKAMKSTPRPAVNVDLNQRHGLGLERFPTPCGSAWGHSGSFPGYWTHAWSNATGKRQVVLMVNADPSAIPDATGSFYKTLFDAYCGTQ